MTLRTTRVTRNDRLDHRRLVGHRLAQIGQAALRQRESDIDGRGLNDGRERVGIGLAREGIAVRVVSIPSTTVFDRQNRSYRERVLDPKLPAVAIEAGVSDYWRKYVGLEGAVVGIDRYGESAPAGDLFKHFGFTVENVVKAVRSTLK